jgi:hypothetical protein
MPIRIIPESRWFEGSVNTDNEHIKITYGDNEEIIAIVEPVSKRDFKVQFLVDLDTKDDHTQKILEDIRQELDFYLVDKREVKPWEYMIYHCTTAANIYSKVHWGYHPKT